jgi:predicted RND superfamily exporter protein
MEGELFGLLVRAREVLRANYEALRPLTMADLPMATRERFLGEGGRTAVFVFPKTPGAGPELEAFVADVRAVAPDATGFPVIYHDSSRSIFRGLVRSSALALIVVVLAVFLHFREVRATLLTVSPLLIAAVAMPAAMKLLGVSHNMANIVSLPLLVGLGTDYGLQLVHHVRTFPEQPLSRALRETGLGVFLAGGTTAAGFGALALARHVGGRSLGLELLLGTVAAMVGALVVLPALLAIERRRGAPPVDGKEPATPPRSATG